MWVDAGFSPDSFWQQTPRSFQLAMAGVRKRVEREGEGRIIGAWLTAAYSGAAQAGKLKPLKHYLKKPARRQTPQEMLAVFRSFHAAGAAMTIRQVSLK